MSPLPSSVFHVSPSHNSLWSEFYPPPSTMSTCYLEDTEELHVKNVQWCFQFCLIPLKHLVPLSTSFSISFFLKKKLLCLASLTLHSPGFPIHLPEHSFAISLASLSILFYFLKNFYSVLEYTSSQGYGFSSGHVWMWELDCEESWAPKNWCFWTLVLEKTLESSLDCEEIQPVHPKRDQSWLFIGRTDAKAETPILRPPHVKSWLIRKDPDAGNDWGQEEKGMTEDEMAGWHHWLDGHEFE